MTLRRPTRILLFALLLVVAGLASVRPVFAHPSAPALLELDASASGTIDVRWQTPRRGPARDLSPSLSPPCAGRGRASRSLEGAGIVETWQVECEGTSIADLEIRFDGLSSSSTAVVLRTRHADGREETRLVTTEGPHRPFSAAGAATATARGFVGLGAEHLLLGADHVLFVVLLTWLIGWGRRLVITLTCFTLGHSITLGLASLGVVAFPTRPVEALIALSVVAAAAEVARPDRPGLLSRAPFLLAGCFGLLHGMGFAGALAELGLPTEQVPLALFAFNAGIELGQLALVAPALIVAWLLGHATASRVDRSPALLRGVPGYALGTVAAVWFWQQLGVS